MIRRDFMRGKIFIGVYYGLVGFFFAMAIVQDSNATEESSRPGGAFNLTPSEWDMETRILHDAYQVAHAVDCAQTYYIAKHPERYREATGAWFLGEHPSGGGVIAWCVTQAYLYSVITQVMVDADASPGVRRVFSAITIGLTLNTVQRNYAIGIKWGF